MFDNIKNFNPEIYLVGGKAQNGKSTVGKFIEEIYAEKNLKTVQLSLGYYFKDYAIRCFGWDGKEETKPRELLQQLGTNVIRQKLSKNNFAIDRTIEDIEILSYFFDCISICDVRLELEMDRISEKFPNAVKIFVKRDNFDNGLTEKQKNHPTETGLDNYNDFDYIIENNGSLNDLKDKVRKLIEERRLLNEKND